MSEGSIVSRKDRIATLRTFFDERKAEVALAASRGLDADKLCRVVLTAVSRTPDLMKCTLESIYLSVMDAAQLGIYPDNKIIGHGYLVPFYNKKAGCHEAQFMVGYRGFIELARRSGQVDSLRARAVYEGDIFEYEYGLEEKLVHKPTAKDHSDARLTHVYAVAVMGSEKTFEVLTRDEIDDVMKATQSRGKYGPWKEYFQPMALKTGIRRLSKYLPLSPDAQTAVAMDELSDARNEAVHVDTDAFVVPDSAEEIIDTTADTVTDDDLDMVTEQIRKDAEEQAVDEREVPDLPFTQAADYNYDDDMSQPPFDPDPPPPETGPEAELEDPEPAHVPDTGTPVPDASTEEGLDDNDVFKSELIRRCAIARKSSPSEFGQAYSAKLTDKPPKGFGLDAPNPQFLKGLQRENLIEWIEGWC